MMMGGMHMIPILLGGAALVGLGAHACASVDNDAAREKNRRANEIIEESNRIAQEAKNLCQSSMDELAKEKTKVLQGNMKRFVRSFSQIKPVNFKDTGDLFEIAKFNKNELMTMQSMVSSVQKINANDVVGGVSGTALAVGAADILTGGAILQGGISVGTLTGGAALGAVAAPIFAITGIFSASEASENLEKAKSNLSKAKAYQDECETYSYLAHAVSERCDLFYETLYNIDVTWFEDAVNQLEILVNRKKTFGNFLKNMTRKKIYSRQEMQMVASVASLAKMVKTIIDTNILDDSGQVTDESERVILEIQDKMENEDLSVRMPEPEVPQQQISMQQATNAYQQPMQNAYQQPIQNAYQQPIQNAYQQPMQNAYQQPMQSAYQQQQSTSYVPQTASAVSATPNEKPVYNPNWFAKFVMWVYTVSNIFGGISIICAGFFIGGCIVFASGLMMCPKINKTMKFWPRFGLMMLLIFIGAFFMV